MDHVEDAELLRRFAQERDEGAFREFVRRYLPLVHHAAVRQLGIEAHAAEDVSQRVFCILAQKAAALAHHSSPVGWLYSTTRFVARDILRRERRRRAREQEAYIMSELSKEASIAAQWARLKPVIDETVAELAAADREAVLLRFFAGLSLA